MKNTTQNNVGYQEYIQGIATKHYQDVKIPVVAGMQLGTKNNKMRKIGFEVYRHYFDSELMDYQVGSQRIKRILKY